MMETEILMPAHESPSAAAYQVEDAAEQIVDTIRRLTVDRAGAIEYVMAQLRLAQKSGEIIGVNRLAAAMKATPTLPDHERSDRCK